MKLLSSVFALSLTLFIGSAAAETVDFNIGHKTFRGGFSGPASRFIQGMNGLYDAGLVFNRQSQGNLYQGHIGLMMTGDVGAGAVDLTGGIGGRLLYTHIGSSDGGAFALGGQASARPTQFNRLSANASSYYAPSITSFGDLNRYFENTVSLDYEVIHGGSVYGGYRNIKQDIGNGGNVSVDNGFNVGMKLKF